MEFPPLLQPGRRVVEEERETSTVDGNDGGSLLSCVIKAVVAVDREEAKKQLWIAVPMIVVNLCTFSITLASVMFAGHLGQLELAAASLANSWAFVTGFALMTGLSGGLETLCGQAYGANEYRMLGIYLQSSLISTFIFCILVSFLWFYAEPILIFFHQNADVSKMASIYLKWMTPGIYAYCFLQCFTRFLQTQSVVLPMVLVSILSLAVEIVLSYGLVTKLSMAFKGAPLAASISLWLYLIFLVVYVKVSNGIKRTWQGLSIESFRYVFSFMKLAMPSAIMVCLEYWAFEILVLLAGLLPNSEISTSLTAMCCEVLLVYLLHAFSLRDISFGSLATGFFGSTRVSNEVGAGNSHQAKIAVAVTLKLSVILAMIMVLSLAFGHDLWASAFSDLGNIKQGFDRMTPLLALSILLDAAQGVLSGVSRGCGWQHLAAWTNLAAFYIVGTPIAILFAFKLNFGTEGLWLGVICGLFCQATMLLLITLRSNWSRVTEASEA